jgi:TatD DNase family protein
MLVDTHAHVNFNAYKDDADEVIRRSLNGGTWMINVGSQYDTSRRAVEIAEKYPQGIYAAIGLHPIHAPDEEFDYEKYKTLAGSQKVVAIGEIGLDYKKEYVSFKQKQKEVFLKQLELAKGLNLPVIFHCRAAHNDLIEIFSTLNKNTMVQNVRMEELRGIVHCFTGTWQEAKKYLETGFYIGFNGIIFKLNLDEIIKKTPLDKILIETDCPYLTPPQVGVGRNEPLFVKYVAEKVAEIKKISYEEIEETTTQNAKKLFKI